MITMLDSESAKIDRMRRRLEGDARALWEMAVKNKDLERLAEALDSLVDKFGDYV